MWITKGKKWLYGMASFCTLPGKEQVAEKFPGQEIEDKKSTVRMTSNALILIPRKESEHCRYGEREGIRILHDFGLPYYKLQIEKIADMDLELGILFFNVR